MSALDILLSALVVLGATSFLVKQLTARAAKPACHTSPPAAGDDVVVGESLQKGLDRARRKHLS